MSKYQLSKEVPWNEILKILRWHIKRHLRIYLHFYEEEKAGHINVGLSDLEWLQVQRGCKAYQSLRLFLGCRGTTVLEQEVEKELRGHPLE